MKRKICSAITALFMFASMMLPCVSAADVDIGGEGYVLLNGGDFSQKDLAKDGTYRDGTWDDPIQFSYTDSSGIYGSDSSDVSLRIYNNAGVPEKESKERYLNLLDGKTGFVAGDTYILRYRLARGNDWQGTIKTQLSYVLSTDAAWNSGWHSDYLELTSAGNIKLGSSISATIPNYTSGRWYDFDFRLTVGTPNKVSLYVDGVKLIDNVDYTAFSGITGIRCVRLKPAASAYGKGVNLEASTIYFDDHYHYLYRTASLPEGAVTVNGDDENVVVKDSKIAFTSGLTAGEVLNALSGNYVSVDYLNKNFEVIPADAPATEGYLRVTTATKVVYRDVTSDTTVYEQDFNDGTSIMNIYNIKGANTKAYLGSIGGKSASDKAFAMNTVSYTAGDSATHTKPTIEAYLPNLSGKSTVEFSIYGSAIGSVIPRVSLTYNGSLSQDMVITADKITFGDSKSADKKFNNSWVRVALTVNTNTDTVSYYVDGSEVHSRTISNLDYYNRVKFELYMNSSVNSGVTALDDFIVYYGGYDASKDKVTLIPDADRGVFVSPSLGTVKIPATITTVDELKNVLGGTYELYDDETLSSKLLQEMGMVTDGQWLVATSPSGKAYAYYTISSDLTIYTEDFQDKATDMTIYKTYTAHAGAYKGGIGGKSEDDYAYAVTTTNFNSSTHSNLMKPSIERSFGTLSGRLTTEFSFYTSNPGEVMPNIFICYNGVLDSASVAYKNNIISLRGTSDVEVISKNRWHRVAVTIDTDDDTAAYYIDGEYVDTVSVPGLEYINRVKVEFFCAVASITSAVTAFDDFELYYGDYACENDVITLSSDENSGVVISEDDCAIIIPDEINTVDMLRTAVTGASWELYDDDNFATQILQDSGVVAKGQYLVATSESGASYKYYKLVSDKVDISEITFAREAETINASVSVKNDTLKSEDYIFVIASYSGDDTKKLEAISFVPVSATVGVTTPGFASISYNASETVKAFMWNKNLMPVAQKIYSAE